MQPVVPQVQNELSGELLTQVLQIALLNSKLPRGMRFEPIEKVEKLETKKKPAKRAKPVFYTIRHCSDNLFV